MKYILLGGLLLVAANSFSQSKKKQIEILQHKLDSISEANDSLELLLIESRRQTKPINRSLETCRTDKARIETKLDKLKSEYITLLKENKQLKGGVENDEKPSMTNSSSRNPVNPIGFGTDTGVRESKGIRVSRKRLNNVSVQNIEIKEDATIYFKLIVDSGGNVVKWYTIKGKTTTTDLALISKIGNEIKKQVKYNENPNGPLVYEYYTIHIRPN